MKTSLRLTAVMALLWGIGWLPSSAPAQTISVSVGNDMPVKDQIGRVLPGRNGLPNSSSLVEIRQTTQWGIIIAPDPDTGAGHPANPLMAASYIGKDSIAAGFFSETFTNRLCPTNSFYARVFDAPEAHKAIYYADSAPFEGTSNNVANIIVTFGAWKLRSTGEPDIDSDGDGIPDAMEMEMGLDPSVADTDGDGYDDLFEVLNGLYLQPSDPDPSLTIALTREVAPEGGPQPPAILSWDTIPVPAMEYVVQFRPIWEDDEAFTNIWSGVYTDERIELDVQEWLDDPSFERGFFRVRIPYERP